MDSVRDNQLWGGVWQAGEVRHLRQGAQLQPVAGGDHRQAGGGETGLILLGKYGHSSQDTILNMYSDVWIMS